MNKTIQILRTLQTIAIAIMMTSILALATTRVLGMWPEWMIMIELIVKDALQ